MQTRHSTVAGETTRKPMTIEQLMAAIKPTPVHKPAVRRARRTYYCQRSGQGRFTRTLRCKADIKKARKRQRQARKAARRLL